MTSVHVLIPSYNCEPWIRRTLESIHTQTLKAGSVLLIDDASPDPAYTLLAPALCESYGYGFIRNAENMKCPANLWYGIPKLAAGPEDVIFLLDGDDFLPHPGVLARIAEVYADPNVELSYGNYHPHPHDTGQTLASAFPREVIQRRTFRAYTRDVRTCFNHPITFRRSLWDRLTEADLRRANGEWFRGGYDLVIMMPMLELTAPDRFRFLDELLYAYNAVNPESDSRVNRNLVEESREILARPPKRRR